MNEVLYPVLFASLGSLLCCCCLGAVFARRWVPTYTDQLPPLPVVQVLAPTYTAVEVPPQPLPPAYNPVVPPSVNPPAYNPVVPPSVNPPAYNPYV
jgi:hypothetical protein